MIRIYQLEEKVIKQEIIAKDHEKYQSINRPKETEKPSGGARL